MATKKVVEEVIEDSVLDTPIIETVDALDAYPYVGSGVYVARKILKLREKVKEITPSKMEAGRQKYNYLSEREMTTTIRPVMQELGLVAIPTNSRQETCSYDLGADKDGNPRRILLTEVHKAYRIIDTETGDSLDFQAEGSGSDTMDKGCNKAVTGCFKNFLKDLGMFPSPEREDPDTTPSNGYSSNKVNGTDYGAIVLKYGTHAGKTIQDLFDENPEEVEKIANATDKSGNPTWLAKQASSFLNSLK